VGNICKRYTVKNSNPCSERLVYIKLQTLGTLAKLRNAILTAFPVFCLSVHVEQFGSHWKNFYQIWCLSVFRESVEKIIVALESVKNKVYFTWRPIPIFDHILLNFCRMKDVSDKSCRENKNTHFSRITFFENYAICEIKWINFLEPDRPQDNNIIRITPIACWIPKLQIRAHNMY
jgi:hypothetical protein